ncbi:MAG: hypothetical protein JWR08_1668 [Enterovirga sp.]|nr:hypothetical protein [Enterovirga sp.]
MTISRDLLVTILDGIGESFFAVDRRWRIVVVNAGAERHCGMSRTDMIGRVLWDLVPGLSESDLGRQFREAMTSVGAVTIEAGSIIRTGRLIQGRFFALPDGMGIAFRDVTDERLQEQALRRREAELARVQRIAGVGGLEVDLRDGFVNRRSPEYLRLHGLPPEAEREAHEAWVQRIHPADRAKTERDFREAVAGSAMRYDAEYRIIRPADGQVRWISATAEIERDAAGRAVRLIGAHRDVTERVAAQQRQKLLIHELNHRVKNTLATVQSIAAQSLRGPVSTADGLAAFEGRLMALSRAHDVLTRENWEGADLHDVVDQATAPYRRSGQDRFHIGGDPLRLTPQTALALAMALQELATNAVKYGALSNDQGRVAIGWTLEGMPVEGLRLRWAETGGPPVSEPSRRGFGSRLIERSLASDLNGKVRIDFAPTGVVCSIEAAIRPDMPGADAGERRVLRYPE